jgi:hypothetical protein
LLKSLEIGVLRRQATPRRDIDDEQDLPRVFTKRGLSAVSGENGDVEQ